MRAEGQEVGGLTHMLDWSFLFICLERFVGTQGLVSGYKRVKEIMLFAVTPSIQGFQHEVEII